MKVTFLGTGTSSGVPMVACDCEVCLSADVKDKRLRSSVLIEINGQNLVIDCGPDFRQQMLRENVKSVDAILFTHEHKDHTGGLDDIRGYNFLSKKPLDIYLQPRVLKALKEQYGYIFKETEYASLPKINPHLINHSPFGVNGVEITPIEVLHHRLPVLGFRINDFTYITDANHISEEEKQKIDGSSVLVLNALREKPHISHFTLQQAIDLVEELQPDRAIFTHISHQLGKHRDVGKKLPPNVELGYDGLQFQL